MATKERNIVRERIEDVADQHRQGDILLVKISELPAYMKEIPLMQLKTPTTILQQSVGSPRPHAMSSKTVKIAETKNQRVNMFIEVLETTPLTHPEHDTIEVEPGIYEVRKQQMWDELKQLQMQALD